MVERYSYLDLLEGFPYLHVLEDIPYFDLSEGFPYLDLLEGIPYLVKRSFPVLLKCIPSSSAPPNLKEHA